MSAATVSTTPAAVVAAPGFARRLLRRPVAIACLVFLTIVVVVAVAGPIVLPQVQADFAGDLLSALQGPSGAHPLGTDSLGRDVLERLVVGTRPTVVGVAEAVVVVLLLGVPVGLAAGYLGGRTDRVVSWLADLMFALPAIIIILAVLAVFPQSMTAAMIAFGIIASPGLMRIVRSAVLPVREELYIAAARVSGLSQTAIVTRHVLPRVIGPVIVQTALLAAGSLLVQSGLAFLGLVVEAPQPSWGGLVADGVASITVQPWLIWPAGVAITLTILAFGLLGNAVRDATTEAWSAPARRDRRPARTAAEAAPTGPARSGLLLSVEDLSISFATPAGENTVVRDVSFDIRPGETVGLVGESGCGKTVTSTSILGMLPGAGRVIGGRILFDGRDLTTLSEREMEAVRGSEIGLISQEPMISLNPVFGVGWQLAQALRRHDPALSRRAARDSVLELLRSVHLPDPEWVARRYPHELSGGMAQRVAIARAIAGKPKLLIADEPTTALDVTVQAEILELLRELQQGGTAILLVTHDWGVVADICERIVVMYAGEVVERSELVSLFRQPLHPYTEALLESTPHHAPSGRLLPTIPGSVPRPGEWPAGCHFHDRCRYVAAECRERGIPIQEPVVERETRCLRFEQIVVR